MKVSLIFARIDDTRLFEQVHGNVATTRVRFAIELNLEVLREPKKPRIVYKKKKKSLLIYLAEARRVIVTQRFGVAERLQQRIRVENDALDVLDLRILAGHGGDVAHDVLGGDRFAGTRFARDNATLTNQRQNSQSHRRKISRGF